MALTCSLCDSDEMDERESSACNSAGGKSSQSGINASSIKSFSSYIVESYRVHIQYQYHEK